MCLSPSARAFLPLLLLLCEEKDFPQDNPLLQRNQLHLPLQGCNVSDHLLGPSPPEGTWLAGMTIADSRWRCSTRISFVNSESGAIETLMQSHAWALGGARSRAAGARKDAPALLQNLFLASPRCQ